MRKRVKTTGISHIRPTRVSEKGVAKRMRVVGDNLFKKATTMQEEQVAGGKRVVVDDSLTIATLRIRVGGADRRKSLGVTYYNVTGATKLGPRGGPC